MSHYKFIMSHNNVSFNLVVLISHINIEINAVNAVKIFHFSHGSYRTEKKQVHFKVFFTLFPVH